MHVRIAALLSLISAVAGAVVLGPEVAVAPPVLAEANGAQLNAVIASAGGDSLAAWYDYDRAGLYVTKIAADGAVAAPARRIYSGNAFGISLCWTGTTYLVTWYDNPGVLAMPLARDGAPTGAARLIAPAQTLTHSGALAWNGQRAFLAYYIYPDHSAAALLDDQANVIRADIALPDTPSQQSAVATAGSTFHLFVRASQPVPVSPGVNRYEDTITDLRFASDGTPIDASGTVVSRTDNIANSWGLASDGNRFALVAIEQRWQSTPALRRFLIDPQTLASQALPAIGVTAPGGAVVTWNGSAFIAVWSDYGHGNSSAMMTMPFSGGTDAQPSAILTLDGMATEAIATFNGRNIVAAWLDRSIGSDVTGVLLDPTATRTAGERFTISTSNQWQVSPALARSLAVWIETEGDNANDVFAAHAKGAGFGPRIRVSTSSLVTLSRPAAVAFTGDTYLVVWQEPSVNAGTATTRIMARRLRIDGTPLDDQPTLVADRGSDPSVAFNGSTVLLAYAGGSSSGVSYGGGSYGGGDASFVAGIRFDRSGNRIDAAPFWISADYNSTVHETSVASNGTDFLVVWRHDPVFFCCSDPPPPPAPPPAPPPTPEILGARVAATGAVLDTQPLNMAMSVESRSSPAVAWSGADYLVAFSKTATVPGVVAQRVLRDGRITGAPMVIDDRGNSLPIAMAIAADATGCWISWSDADIHLAHIGASGVDVAPAVIATGAIRPAFAPGSIAYSRTDPDQTLVVVRALPALVRGRAAGH